MKYLELMEMANAYVSEVKTVVSGPKAVGDVLKPLLINETQEKFFVVFVDVKNQITAIENLFVGGYSSAIVDPKVIFKAGLLNGASKLIIAHNHPSGSTVPSREDIKVTDTLIAAGKMLALPVIDHIIIGGGNPRAMSFKENGYCFN